MQITAEEKIRKMTTLNEKWLSTYQETNSFELNFGGNSNVKEKEHQKDILEKKIKHTSVDDLFGDSD